MAATLEWDVPFKMTTPYGTLLINQEIMISGQHIGYFMLDHLSCTSGAEMRMIRDDIPQQSGEIQHLHYKTGYEMRLKMELWDTIGGGGRPAYHSKRVALGDLLQLHLESIIAQNPYDPYVSGRIQWTPSGTAIDRMLDGIRMLERPVFMDEGEEALTAVSFAVLSPFPYAMDAPQTTTHLTSGAPVTLNNTGTAPFYPVIKVNGPAASFQIYNNSVLDLDGNPLFLSYDSGLPGGLVIPGGQYGEFGFFYNTAYLNGNGANLKPGIDITQSDFFPLIPGNNQLEIFGTSADVLWQPAYA